MAIDPSMNNTKKEILAAYNELMAKKKSEKDKRPKEEKIEKQKQDTVKEATEISADGIVKELAEKNYKFPLP